MEQWLACFPTNCGRRVISAGLEAPALRQARMPDATVAAAKIPRLSTSEFAFKVNDGSQGQTARQVENSAFVSSYLVNAGALLVWNGAGDVKILPSKTGGLRGRF